MNVVMKQSYLVSSVAGQASKGLLGSADGLVDVGADGGRLVGLVGHCDVVK